MAKSKPRETARERELRTLVEEHPDDTDAIVVYADWLEEQGDLPRATFLRLQLQLRATKVSHPKLLERGRALFDLGKTLPREWVAAMSQPKLAGTAWDGHDDDGSLVWRFLASGMINYTQPSGTYENGRWEQIGNTVAMDTNAHYADYFGVIVGDVIRGNAHNIVEHEWRWKVKRTGDPQVAGVPGDVNRTIHDDHVRARRRAPPKPRRSAPKSPAPLRRKKPLARKTRPRTRRT